MKKRSKGSKGIQEKVKPISLEGVDQLVLFGPADSNLRTLERISGTRIVIRNGQIVFRDDNEAARQSRKVLLKLIELVETGQQFSEDDIVKLYEGSDSVEEAIQEEERLIYLSGRQRIIRAKSEGQRRYLRAMDDCEIVVGIGPAGTGKTYLAVSMALDFMNKKRVKRLVLARPAVEAGESLGFLPGDIQEKVDPYLRPLYDALYDMLPPDKIRRALNSRVIEVAPLAYMRGRTLNDAFVILDEAQNTTKMQMKMFLTRLGLNSRAVITGDKTQIDLVRPSESGLLDIERILKRVEGIEFIYLTEKDVVRHRLVQEIIRAYESSQGKDS
ncbi:MAG: PhoH family protein [Candidatus Glassbacteria bacterium]